MAISCSVRPGRRVDVQALAAVVAFAATAAASGLQAQPVGRYSAVEFSRFDEPGLSTVVRRINTLREVAGGFGRADLRRASAAAILTGTGLIDVAADQATDHSVAHDINDQGEVAGAFNGPTALRPFRSVRRSAFLEMALLPGDTGGAAFAMNEAGEAVGYSSGAAGERAVWWTRLGAVRELPGLPGAAGTRALAANLRGDIVGASGDAPRRAVLWPAKGAPVDLGTLAGFVHSEAVAINERGQIAGTATGTDGAPYRSRAVLWGAGGQPARDLGTLVGAADSRARDINARGEVVGMSAGAGSSRAFVWTAAAGMVDLNTLVSLPGLVLIDALGINRNGEIVAVAQEQHAHAPGVPEHGDHESPRRVLVLSPSPSPAR